MALQTDLTGVAMGVSPVQVMWLVPSLLWLRNGIISVETSPFIT